MAAFKNHFILYFLKGAPESDLSGLWVSHALLSGNICLWISLTLQSMFFRPSLLPWAAASACGAASTFWKVTAMTTPALMLMCDKVTPQYDRQPPLLFRTKGHSIRRVHDFMLYLKY